MSLHAKYAVVIRSWQRRAGYPDTPLNKDSFVKRLYQPISTLLKTATSEFSHVVVVVNGDTRFHDFFGEYIDENNMTPTMSALRQIFDDRVQVVLDTEWGNNAGSATALNVGWRKAIEHDPSIDRILSWNPEMDLTGHQIDRMLHFMEDHCLEIVGHYRAFHWERPQFDLFQNTACMYLTQTLLETDGFHERTNGNDGLTVNTETFGPVTLAGMDDQEMLMRLAKQRGSMPRIGMIGRNNPSPWQTVFPGEPERQRAFDIKVERQFLVLQEWLKIHFPDMSLREYLSLVFQNMYIGM